MGDGSTVFKLPSRLLPATAILIALCTILGSVGCCFYFHHDIGGIMWPYISDTAKGMPQAGFFSFGMTVVSVLVLAVVFINHGKLKLNLYALSDGRGPEPAGLRRAKLARIAGCLAAPNLGLLACYDAERSPKLHLLFVLGFFVPCLVYFICIISVYRLMVSKVQSRLEQGRRELQGLSYVTLETSLMWKQRIGACFAFFFTLYLPVGMSFVSDWYDYRNDVAIHSFRAVAQHATIVSLILFFGTMWFDFGGLVFRISQGGAVSSEPPKKVE